MSGQIVGFIDNGGSLTLPDLDLISALSLVLAFLTLFSDRLLFLFQPLTVPILAEVDASSDTSMSNLILEISCGVLHPSKHPTSHVIQKLS